MGEEQLRDWMERQVQKLSDEIDAAAKMLKSVHDSIAGNGLGDDGLAKRTRSNELELLALKAALSRAIDRLDAIEKARRTADDDGDSMLYPHERNRLALWIGRIVLMLGGITALSFFKVGSDNLFVWMLKKLKT